jgi:hypothetical protein
MQGLSERQRQQNFNVKVYAVRSDDGVVACIAGHCGLDPWFQGRGFITTVGESLGTVSVEPHRFFGTGAPFFQSSYASRSNYAKTVVTFEDALCALDRAINLFADAPSTAQAVVQ